MSLISYIFETLLEQFLDSPLPCALSALAPS